jgi:hypothetical protein
MPIPVQCTGCPVRLNAPDTAAGKMVKCPKCQTLVPVPSAAPAPPPPTPAPPPPRAAALDFDDEPTPAPVKKLGTAPKPAAKPAPPPEPLGLDDEPAEEPPARKSGTAPRPAARKPHDDDEEEEETDKKSRRKRRGAAAGGPPVALVLSIAGLIGLGIVCAVGYAAHSMIAGREDAKGGGGGGATKTAVPTGWKEFTSKSGGFKAYFPPGEVRERAYDQPTGKNPPTGKKKEQPQYSGTWVVAEAPDGSVMVMVAGLKFRPGVSADDREKVMNGLTDVIAGGGQEKVAGAKVLGQRDVTWLGQKGQELVVELPASEGGGQMVLRHVLVGSTGYIGIIGTKNGRAKPEDENGFFDNIEVLK